MSELAASVAEWVQSNILLTNIFVACVVAFIGFVVRPLRSWIAKKSANIWRWIRKWRLTQEPKTLPVKPFVARPNFEILNHNEIKNAFLVKNNGGLAKHVRLSAHNAEINGTLDKEIVAKNDGLVFKAFLSSSADFDGAIIFVDCLDENGEVMSTQELSIPGPLGIFKKY